MADSGLDSDACQFRLGPERDQVTLAIDFPQPPGAVQDKPAEKVITYYLVGAAEAYDDNTGGFHGTHTAGNVLGDNYAHLAEDGDAGHDSQDGMAPAAQLVMQDIGANDGRLSGLRGVSSYDLMKQAYDTGARIHNNSYGFSMLSTSYDADSASIDEAAWRLNDLLIVFAAGNSGYDFDNSRLAPESLGGTGSTSKNTLVVGASGPVELNMYGSYYQLAEDMLFFSSQGPCQDGRIKPDLVAPGMVFSADSHYAARIDLGCCDVYGHNMATSNNEDDNCNVDEDWPTPGTSFSSPLVAGAAALVRQYFTDGYWALGRADVERGILPTNALLKAMLITGAKPLDGQILTMGDPEPLDTPPSPVQGWGRAHLDNVLAFEGDVSRCLVLADVPNPVPGNPMLTTKDALHPAGLEALSTGEEASWTLPGLDDDSPMSVCLVWSDPPAAPGANPTLINNLDLELTLTDGGRYLGNAAINSEGQSQPVTTESPDGINNVECIHLSGGDTKDASLRVRAVSVPGNGDAGSEGQGYALVAIGAFTPPIIESLSVTRAAPGEVLLDVEARGEGFLPGLDIELGAGISVRDVTMIDHQTAHIGSIMVFADTEEGPRQAVAIVHHSLRSAPADLFDVGTGGCSCGNKSPFGLSLLGLMAILLLQRRLG
ncbi:MAG: S8 family serine peptidase [Deltaproteobacteria bacterium]|nr:S8 family serine peptidase [Deltaproteobacteria bacterium]